MLFPLPGTLFPPFFTWLTAKRLQPQFNTPSRYCPEAPQPAFPLAITCSSFWLLNAGTDCIWVTVTFPMPRMCPEHGDAQQMVDRSRHAYVAPLYSTSSFAR